MSKLTKQLIEKQIQKQVEPLESQSSGQTWHSVCRMSDLIQDAGVCALINDKQIALFNIKRQGKVYAVSNFDPIGKANVMYRGIIGSVQDEPVIASPLYKQQFSLTSGRCLQEQDKALHTFDVRINEDTVQVFL